MSFADRVVAASERKAPCIVGPDPALARMPQWLRERCTTDTSGQGSARALLEYNLLVLDVIHDLVPVVKPQSAYYEVFGSEGIRALEATIARARELGLVVLLDAKRGDIGSTAEAYARAYLSETNEVGGANPLHVDALTLNPYLGRDSLEPFLTCTRGGQHGVFVCVKTSNPGSGDLQDLVVDDRPLYRHVAMWIREAYATQPTGSSGYANVGAVVGATYPDDAIVLREDLPQSLFLVPGLGAQGGDPGRLRAFFDGTGRGALVSASRAIMYPSTDLGDSEQTTRHAIRRATEEYVESVVSAVRL